MRVTAGAGCHAAFRLEPLKLAMAESQLFQVQVDCASVTSQGGGRQSEPQAGAQAGHGSVTVVSIWQCQCTANFILAAHVESEGDHSE